MPRILVIEDEPTIRALVRDILSASHECHAVRTAEEGLALLGAADFDAVITDIKLPGMRGDEFLRRARGLNPAMPVIVISGGFGYDEPTYTEEGAFGYLLKPFRAEELEEIVARALSAAR
jgi:two-component system response regulator AtoC